MPCHHPLPAWRTQTGQIVLTKAPKDSYTLQLPCGNCLGCRATHAKAWALRCQLELQQHQSALWTTLTYDEENKPPTLDKRHLQLWLKKLRRAADESIRFFASGEYGTKTERPHYHAILYGLDANLLAHRALLEKTWDYGAVRKTVPVTPKIIAYTAGYTAKKIGFKEREKPVQLDKTGTFLYHWQPPFIQMSRKPGIGGKARKWINSWRLYAIQNGHKMPVPRYLHEAWKQQASEEDKENLLYEKYQLALNRDTQDLVAAEKIAIKKQELSGDSRNY